MDEKKNHEALIDNLFLRTWRPFAWIILLTALLYAQTIAFNFNNFDDKALIVDKYAFLQNPANITEAFKQSVFASQGDVYYRPILTLSFMLDYQISGISPWMYHVSNIIFHIIAALLLFVLLCRLNYTRILSLLMALIFAVHPVLTQAVCWVPGRNDSLATIFILASFIFFLNFVEKKKSFSFLWHILFAALALFTKESSLTVFLIMAFYLMFIAREKIWSYTGKMLLLGWITVTIIWILARAGAAAIPGQMAATSLIGTLWQNLPGVFVFLGKIIFPFNLSVMPTLEDSTLIFGIIVLALLVITLLATKGIRIRYLLFGLLWFVVFLFPTFLSMNIFTSKVFLEHRLYLPLVGFIILVLETGAIKAIARRNDLLVAVGLAIIAFFSIITSLRSQIFRDSRSFWASAVAASPHSPTARTNFGAELYWEGSSLIYRAEETYAQSLQNNPNAKRDKNSLDYSRGVQLINQAEAEFRKSLELNPNEKLAHTNIGLIYLFKRMYPEAEVEFKKELDANPFSDRAHYNLGYLYLKMRQAKREEAKALADKGNAAESEQKLKEANELTTSANKCWVNAVGINPENGEAYKQIIVFYLEEMNFPEAFKGMEALKKRKISMAPVLESWAKAYQANPGSVDSYRILLDFFLKQAGDFSTAGKYAKALQEKGVDLPNDVKQQLNIR